jgi:hypothetical protein
MIALRFITVHRYMNLADRTIVDEAVFASRAPQAEPLRNRSR